MKIKYLKISGSCILFIITCICVYTVFFKTTTRGGPDAYTAMDIPDWLVENISTSSSVIDNESGPTISSGEDAYGVFKISFYDASTKKRITDKDTIEELLSMFQYTEEPFIYDSKRSNNGISFFYYNRVLPAKNSPSLFSGFQGKEDFPQGSPEKLVSFYVRFHASTIPAAFSDDLEKALDEF